MTGQAITTLDAAHIIGDYRMRVWPEHTFEVGPLGRILAGSAVTGVCEARPDGVDEPTAYRVLDEFDAANGRPPSPPELAVELDRVLNPEVIVAHIGDARAALNTARARVKERDRQLRDQTEERARRTA